MKIVIGVNRKVGMPNYSSDGASCEITLDLSEQSVSANPASLVDEIRRAYSLAEQAVSEQLDRHAAPGVEQPPARAGLPSQARPPSTPQVDRQTPAGQYDPQVGPDGSARWKTDGFPRSGRELVPWAKKREESGQCPNLWKRLIGFGVASNFPSRVVEWSREEVSAAVHAVLGGDDQYDDEPAPATNGYHNGNGRSY